MIRYITIWLGIILLVILLLGNISNKRTAIYIAESGITQEDFDIDNNKYENFLNFTMYFLQDAFQVGRISMMSDGEFDIIFEEDINDNDIRNIVALISTVATNVDIYEEWNHKYLINIIDIHGSVTYAIENTTNEISVIDQ